MLQEADLAGEAVLQDVTIEHCIAYTVSVVDRLTADRFYGTAEVRWKDICVTRQYPMFCSAAGARAHQQQKSCCLGGKLTCCLIAALPPKHWHLSQPHLEILNIDDILYAVRHCRRFTRCSSWPPARSTCSASGARRTSCSGSR